VPILVSQTPPGPDEPVVVEPPAAKVSDEPTLTWNGWTGDSWTLAGDRYAGTFIEQDGMGGLLEPPVQHYFSESTRDGSTWQGHRIPVREVTVPLFVWAESPSEMRTEDARFRATLRPEKTGTLVVTEPNGARRELTLRYVAGAEGKFGSDTYGRYWMRHDLTLVAEDPYFYGDEVSFSFGNAAGLNFFGGGAVGVSKGPPFYISSSQTIGSAAIANPGTEDAYLTWTIHGAMTTFQGGWGTNLINLPIALTSSQWLEVNTDPEWNTIVDQSGANRWPSVGSAEITFAPLPAGVTTDLGLTVGGPDTNTMVEVAFRPKFRAAW